VTDVLLPLAIVLIAAEFGAALAHALGQPRVVGQICAGIALGPTVLGVVSDGPQVAMLASVGALAILATAGLETNVEAMRRVGRSAFFAAVGGVLVPLAGGTALALAFGLDTRQAYSAAQSSPRRASGSPPPRSSPSGSLVVELA
jgi:Kef-type K+ transport system membrane component KefB